MEKERTNGGGDGTPNRQSPDSTGSKRTGRTASAAHLHDRPLDTRSLEEFIALLQAHGVTRVADVRTVPRSRHNPQFNRDTLPDALSGAGVGYRHIAKLGGLRHGVKDSPNTGWRNASFRGFADYMQTAEFAEGLDELLDLARQGPAAILCAEAVPWRCHRSLIADALLARGIPVEEIIGAGRTQIHKLTPFARVEGLKITYPAVEAEHE